MYLFPTVLAEFRADAGIDRAVLLCGSADRTVYRKVFRGADGRRGLYQDRYACVYRGAHFMRSDRGKRAAGGHLQFRSVPAGL